MLDRVEEFRNLLALATIDGGVTERELEFLAGRANRWGISDQDFADSVSRAVRHRGEVVIPRSRADRRELLREMLRMMAADGALSDEEKRMFAVIAVHMRISNRELDDLIDTVVQETIVGTRPTTPTEPPAPARRPRSTRPTRRKTARSSGRGTARGTGRRTGSTNGSRRKSK